MIMRVCGSNRKNKVMLHVSCMIDHSKTKLLLSAYKALRSLFLFIIHACNVLVHNLLKLVLKHFFIAFLEILRSGPF